MPIVLLVLASASARADEPPARSVLAWPAGPMEVRVAFDRPLDAQAAEAVVGRTIPYYPGSLLRATGQSIPAGKALGQLKVAGARLADDRRTLILATDPHPRQAYYDLSQALREHGGRQDRGYTLAGVEATWDDGREGSPPQWTGWVRNLAFDQDPRWSEGPAGYRALKELMAQPGRLTLKGQCDIPPGRVVATVQRVGTFRATVNGEEVKPVKDVGRFHRAEMALLADGNPVEVVVTATTGPEAKAALKNSGVPPSSSLSFQWRPEASEKEKDRHYSDLVPPWVPATLNPAATAPAPPFDLKGGDPKKGEAVFVSEAAKCSACHAIAGKGGNVGPALDSLKSRDLADVFHQIAEPSATILPDYLTYTVARKDGQVVVGVVRAEGFDAVRVTDIGAKPTLIPKGDIEDLRPSAASTMPVGLPGALGEANMRDLLAYLTRKE